MIMLISWFQVDNKQATNQTLKEKKITWEKIGCILVKQKQRGKRGCGVERERG